MTHQVSVAITEIPTVPPPAGAAPVFTSVPVVISRTDTTLRIQYINDVNTQALVEISPTGANTWTTEVTETSFDYGLAPTGHINEISGLSPATGYDVRVTVTATDGQQAVDTTLVNEVTDAASPVDPPPSSVTTGRADGGLYLGWGGYGGRQKANGRIANEWLFNWRAPKTGNAVAIHFHKRFPVSAEGRFAEFFAAPHNLNPGQVGHLTGSYAMGELQLQAALNAFNAPNNPGAQLSRGPTCDVTNSPNYNFFRLPLGAGGAATVAGQRYSWIMHNMNPMPKIETPYNGNYRVWDANTNSQSKISPLSAAVDHVRGVTGGAWSINGTDAIAVANGPQGGPLGGLSTYFRNDTGDAWSEFRSNIRNHPGQAVPSFYIEYDDGEIVGHTWERQKDLGGRITQRIVQSNQRIRVVMDLPGADTTVDGVWIYMGHTGSANGTALTVQVKNAAGVSQTQAQIESDPAQRQQSAGSALYQQDSAMWHYADFDAAETLAGGDTRHYIELSASAGAGWYIPLFYPDPAWKPQYTDQFLPQQGTSLVEEPDWLAVEYSSNGGGNWGNAGNNSTYAMQLKMTIQGNPKQW